MSTRQIIADLLALVGMAGIGVGVWWLSPAWALIVVGALLATAGILLGRRN